MGRVKAALKWYLIITGLLANTILIWMAADGPIFIDSWLDVTGSPMPAEVIICPTAGLSSNNLPTETGWRCIYTAVQLYFDGFGRRIVFSGAGSGKVTEAEVYAEAAGWLGCPEEAREFEPMATNTAEHPVRLLAQPGLGITRDTSMNIVSSALHSRRLELCFRKAGFSKFRIVAGHLAQKGTATITREMRISRFAGYRPSGKSYDDIFNRLRFKMSGLFQAMREVAAIIFYKFKGYI